MFEYALDYKKLFVFNNINDDKVSILNQNKKNSIIKNEDLLLCKFCRNKITSIKYSINIFDKHIHSFKNPMGLLFTIGCFSEADGCLITGNPTTQFTWFPDYSWSVILCSNCMIHLGWFYQNASNGFFGLIMDNLING